MTDYQAGVAGVVIIVAIVGLIIASMLGPQLAAAFTLTLP